MRNMLAEDIALAEGKSQYDAQCKKVLSNRTILAWILKRTVQECQELSVSQIKACICGEPEVSNVRVEPGRTNRLPEQVVGDANEDSQPDEGAIYFDIRLHMLIPARRKTEIKLIINIEAQKEFYPGYNLVTRGIFYGARLISSQLGTEFTGSNYDSIKKVYSIWICMNAPKYIGNAISIYSIGKKDIVPGIPDRPGSYDKLSVICICLCDGAEDGQELTRMLNVLLSPSLRTGDKIEKLENDFQIEMEYSLGKELEQMCNLSDYVEEIGIEKGIEKGRDEGKNLNLIELIQKKCRRNKSLEETAADLEEEPQAIEAIYRIVQKYPHASCEEILMKLKE